MAKKNNAFLGMPEVYRTAGIVQPKQNKYTEGYEEKPYDLSRYQGIVDVIAHQDQQDAIKSIEWFNLPDITGEELERLLYHKGEIAMFYFKPLDQFFYMPFTLATPDDPNEFGLDFYGRYRYIQPVPLATDNVTIAKQNILFSTMRLKVYYNIPIDELTPEQRMNAAVIIRDYTPTTVYSQHCEPRAVLNKPLIQQMAECYPLAGTSLIASAAPLLVRVQSPDEASNVKMTGKVMKAQALSGQWLNPVVGNIDFQDITASSSSKAEDYLMTMQSLDNFRLSTHGLSSGGIFEKKERKLVSEQVMNMGTAGQTLADRCSQRRNSCLIAQGLWGTEMVAVPSETAMGIDMNGDGMASDSADNSNNMATTTNEGGDEDNGND